MTSLGVGESALAVVQQCRLVKISDAATRRLADRIAAVRSHALGWNRTYHLDATGDTLVQYLMVLDTLNFCFWGDPKWSISYVDEVLDGYWALAASLRRAILDGCPLLDSRYLETIGADDLRRVFRGSGEIPMIDERASALRESGEVLGRLYEGQAGNIVRAANGSAAKFVQLIVDGFSSFDDTALYSGTRVRFFKRAQILAADICLAVRVEGEAPFNDLHELTAFADYKVPQVLRANGVLEYADTLASRIDSFEELGAGSPEEVEIRASTIVAIERLGDQLRHRGADHLPIEIDWILWELGQDKSKAMAPYHRTRTIYY